MRVPQATECEKLQCVRLCAVLAGVKVSYLELSYLRFTLLFRQDRVVCPGEPPNP